MQYDDKVLIDVAKELTIAKLSNTAPTHTNAEIGKQIGAMYHEIYNSLKATIYPEQD